MQRVVKRTLIGLAAVILALIFLVWLFVASPLFSNVRTSILSEILSDQIGQPLQINGDASADLGTVMRVNVSDVLIPSEDLPDVALAELARLQMDVNLVALFSGDVDIDNLKVDGLSLDLITTADGTTSWTKAPSETEKAPQGMGRPPGILAFLGDREITFSEIKLTIKSAVSGFEFDFDLHDFGLHQLDGDTGMTMVSSGTVNDQTFTIDGSYPRGEENRTVVDFGPLAATFVARPAPGDEDGFAGDLNIDAKSFGDLFDVLRLDRAVEGTGSLGAHIVADSDAIMISEISTEAEMEDGKRFTLNGTIANLLNLSGLDISIKGQMFPEDQPPALATELKDLRLTSIDTQIVSGASGMQFKQLHLETNALERSFERIGPVSIHRVYRTEEGAIALTGIDAALGPEGAPVVRAKGNINDLFRFRGLGFTGTMDAPASLALPELGAAADAAFGRVTAQFNINDDAGHLTLSDLSAQTEGTDLWSLKFDTKTENLQKLAGVASDLDVSIADTAAFLTALGHDPVDAGALELSMSVKGDGADLATSLLARANDTQIDVTLNTQITDSIPIARGGLRSERITMKDISTAIEAVFVALTPDEEAPEDPAPDPEATEEDAKPAAEPEAEGQAPPPEPENVADLLDLDRLLRDLDLEFGIEVTEIVGVEGTSSVSSQITAKEGKASAGPLEFSYGKGFVKFFASVDVIESPDWIAISGETGGWDIGAIFDEMGLDIKAHGVLQGQFDLGGSSKSINAFINSLTGSATISMWNGRIGTSLIEVAGLGAIPWLFSKESAQGYSDIVCVVAPLSIKRGAASSNAMVLETKSVQLVAAGTINWRDDAISLRAEPRPVGRPLSRSAFPFEVTGRLSKPNFDVQVGAPSLEGLFAPKQQQAERKPCRPDIKQTTQKETVKDGAAKEKPTTTRIKRSWQK